MTAAARGQIDVILVFQRPAVLAKPPRAGRGHSRESSARTATVSLIATKGPSLDMRTAYGRAMAGLLGEFDTMESEVKAERQRGAIARLPWRHVRAKGTPRPFGWQADRVTADPGEKGAIVDACRALLAGGTVPHSERLGAARRAPSSGTGPPVVPDSCAGNL